MKQKTHYFHLYNQTCIGFTQIAIFSEAVFDISGCAKFNNLNLLFGFHLYGSEYTPQFL